jgi:hypothetical protein
MTQFDTRVADRLWDGTVRDPDAPPWYRDVRSLIHRARGPAEPQELIDEPLVVSTMHRVRLGSTIARLPRSSGVRTIGRVLAMKAAAATTTGLIGVAAAAAATTGIVATVAATVVVPVVKDHVVPVINTISPAMIPAEVASPPTTEGQHSPSYLDQLAGSGDPTVMAPVEVLAPTAQAATAPENAEPAPESAPSEPAGVPTSAEDDPAPPDAAVEEPVEEPPPPVTEAPPVVEQPLITDEPPVVDQPETPVEPVSPVEPHRPQGRGKGLTVAPVDAETPAPPAD